jgi:hypothetical protein
MDLTIARRLIPPLHLVEKSIPRFRIGHPAVATDGSVAPRSAATPPNSRSHHLPRRQAHTNSNSVIYAEAATALICSAVACGGSAIRCGGSAQDASAPEPEGSLSCERFISLVDRFFPPIQDTHTLPKRPKAKSRRKIAEVATQIGSVAPDIAAIGADVDSIHADVRALSVPVDRGHY